MIANVYKAIVAKPFKASLITAFLGANTLTAVAATEQAYHALPHMYSETGFRENNTLVWTTAPAAGIMAHAFCSATQDLAPSGNNDPGCRPTTLKAFGDAMFNGLSKVSPDGPAYALSKSVQALTTLAGTPGALVGGAVGGYSKAFTR